MKICQINCVYGVGSTGKIVRDIHHSLINGGIDSIVIAPLKNSFTSEEGVFTVSNKLLSYGSAILRRYLGMTYDWAYIQTRNIIHILKTEKPDIVHLQCINGNDINIYMLEKYLAEKNIKTLYTIHAEFPYTGGCGYAFSCEKFLSGCGHCPCLRESTQSPFIDGTHRTWNNHKNSYGLFKTSNLQFATVSPWLLERANMSPMLKSFKKESVLNGVETEVFNRNVTKKWREKLGFADDEKMLVHVTARFTPYENNIKGGHLLVKLAERLKREKVKIVVAAGDGVVKDIPGNIIYIGRAKNQQELASLYSEANLSVITSSRETFCMPVAESLCCGTPVVGFKAGGPESIALNKYSEFVEYGDIDALEKTVLTWINKEYNKDEIAKEAQSIYSKEAMTNNYIKIYKQLVREN